MAVDADANPEAGRRALEAGEWAEARAACEAALALGGLGRGACGVRRRNYRLLIARA